MILVKGGKCYSVINSCRRMVRLGDRAISARWSGDKPGKAISACWSADRAMSPAVTQARTCSHTTITSLAAITDNLVGSRDKMTSYSIMEKNAREFCSLYSSLSGEETSSFLVRIAGSYGVESDKVARAATKLLQNNNQALESRLQGELKSSLDPPFNQIFSRLGQIQGGVKFLVDLRRDAILAAKTLDPTGQSAKDLKDLIRTLQQTLSAWFSVGFLQIERVTWSSPCSLLERISEYEAVHPVRDWTDLKTRVGPYRRCFVYTHPSMPGEPVVVLHVALTPQISSSITSLVKDHRTVRGFSETRWSGFAPDSVENLEDCKSAIFYSITSTQTGLQGIELGTHLIKQAVKELQSELPHLATFSTLSPIPGFRSWLLLELARAGRGEAANPLLDEEIKELCEVYSLPESGGSDSCLERFTALVKSGSWLADSAAHQTTTAPAAAHQTTTAPAAAHQTTTVPAAAGQLMRTVLMRLCARYLYLEKRRTQALDSVANFHLRNGAVLWRLNWLADPSPRGVSNSCGIMVNYRYYLDRLEENSTAYLQHNTVMADTQVLSLLPTPGSKL